MSAPASGTAHATFYSVADVAVMLGMSDMTLYRAIRDGQFPAVRVRGRLIIPARAIEALVDAAAERGELVDAADWVDGGSPLDDERQAASRPRPGANQTGAGSFTTQHKAGYGEHVTPARRARTRGGVA